MKKKTFFYMLDAKGAGFCSEINNILYAIYFFQKKGYSFKLISFNWISSYDKGWGDYFDSLKVQHFSNSFNFKQTQAILYFLNYVEKTYLIRILGISNGLRKFLFRFISKNCYIRCKGNFEEIRKFCYYEREVNYDMFCLSMNKILNNMWVIKPEIQKEIQEEIKKKIPENLIYTSIHIRRGDKVTSKEDRKYETKEYIDTLLKLNLKTKVIFLLSDDYNSYIEMKEELPDFKIITFLNKKQPRGYDHNHFISLPKKDIKSETIQFLTEIEIAKKSAFLIGSHKSNVFRLLKYFKLDNCIDISQTTNSL